MIQENSCPKLRGSSGVGKSASNMKDELPCCILAPYSDVEISYVVALLVLRDVVRVSVREIAAFCKEDVETITSYLCMPACDVPPHFRQKISQLALKYGFRSF